ncbi:dihydroxy-acid dehydratase [Microbulbifer sp. JSM ZJ756]|uniref:dihydroxy-acid dehydratase domain-containing protein n=1 Tax=Microbulbifer sp. JSM ZJ756 TaxID=3376191 RepID=UPI0037A72FBF
MTLRCSNSLAESGPVGFPGSGEVVKVLPPRALVKRGTTCLPTMGGGRQSGTPGSPPILSIPPEAAIGGGLEEHQS